ncbi:MAG TPA: flagellar hook-basal body complex protein [Candidatus Saccharimonadales bacterium]|jgi:flagellar hook protein FlgE|nr:flagellar hook-basal body complex protein [Candidatus Saccharimonadales bacterium]
MLRSLTSAISGLQSFQQQMDVIGNNVANVNTTAFKSARVELADAFSQTLQSSSAGSGGNSGTPGMQIGCGVVIQAINNIYSQGALARTGVGTDLAVSGSGYFVVRNTLDNNTYVTRAGDFRVDQAGYLVTNGGLRVQGYSDAALSTMGDIVIDTTGMPPSAPPAPSMVSFAISVDGKINVSLSNGSQFVRGQILMQNFTDPQGLMKESNNLYSGIGAAGPLGGAASPTPAPPGTNGMGTIQAGALELSNVDLASEFTNLITTQRAYQANARVITTSDEMLQELVNLKR